MKRILLMISIMITCVKLVNAQDSATVSSRLREVNNDTLKYVKNSILDNNRKYVGKTFEFLVQDLPTSIKHYVNCSLDRPYGAIPVTQLYLYQYNEIQSKLERKTDPIIITITWKKPYTFADLEKEGLPISGLLWKEAGYKFLKNRIIEKVEMVNFDFSLPTLNLR